MAGGPRRARDLCRSRPPARAGARSCTRSRPPSSSCERGARAPCERARAGRARPRPARARPSPRARRPRTPCRARRRPGAGSCAPGASVSRRAAISACTESGTSTSPAPSSPRSASRRTNSSAYSGLPPARSSSACCVSAGSTARSSSVEIRRAVSSSVSGARLIRCRVAQRSQPKPGCCSYSSGRAVQSTSSGTPSAQSARCSRKESRASSAQCRSSKTSTVGRSRGQRLEEAPPRGERLLLRGGLRQRPRRAEPGAAFSQARSGSSGGSARSSFASASSGESDSRMPALGLDDLPERPEGDPLAVGQAAALPPARRARARPRGRRRARRHRRLLPTPGSPTIVTSWQERCCAERSKVPIRSGFSSSRPTSGVACVRITSRAEAGARRERAVERERLRLALHLHRLERLVVEDALGRAVGLLRDRDPVHRRRALQARGGVDHVARHDPLALLRARAERNDRLARVDPDPHLQRERRVRLVQLLDRLQDPKAGPDRALGVVLVRDGRTEDRHHRVPDELLDRPAVALDLLPQARVVGPDARAHVLGVRSLRGGGEADEVAEEDGDHLALLLHRRAPAARSGRGAVRAERELARELLAAGRDTSPRARV